MDMFRNAAVVRLCSNYNKYLTAEEDEEGVTLDRSRSSRNAHWAVEFVGTVDNVIRLKSRYNKYLTPTNKPFPLGKTGNKVLQTAPQRLDSSVEWEPVREGNQFKFKTRYGNFLRGNGGLPPWRNSVTHDVPNRKELVLWDVEILETQVQLPHRLSEDSSRLDSFDSSGTASFSKYEGNEVGGRVETVEGRTVYYHIAMDVYADGGDEAGGFGMIFGGTSVEELRHRLEEETGLEDIAVCTRSPLNGKLYPLRLQLPPNITMQVVVVPRDSEAAKDLANAGIIL